jgi:hypothetical protein
MLLRPGLDGKGLFRAGQAGQVEQHRHLVVAVQGLRRAGTPNCMGRPMAPEAWR